MKPLTLLISSEVLMTDPSDKSFTFTSCGDLAIWLFQICCRAGDHNSPICLYLLLRTIIYLRNISEQFRSCDSFQDNSISLWHTIRNNDSHMSWTRPDEDLYLFWCQEVKGKGNIRTLNLALFSHYNYILFIFRMMMILDAFVACDPRRTPIYGFGVNG